MRGASRRRGSADRTTEFAPQRSELAVRCAGDVAALGGSVIEALPHVAAQPRSDGSGVLQTGLECRCKRMDGVTDTADTGVSLEVCGIDCCNHAFLRSVDDRLDVFARRSSVAAGEGLDESH